MLWTQSSLEISSISQEIIELSSPVRECLVFLHPLPVSLEAAETLPYAQALVRLHNLCQGL